MIIMILVLMIVFADQKQMCVCDICEITLKVAAMETPKNICTHTAAQKGAARW